MQKLLSCSIKYLVEHDIFLRKKFLEIKWNKIPAKCIYLEKRLLNVVVTLCFRQIFLGKGGFDRICEMG